MPIAQGLYITVFGMALVFLALGVIMVATMALERLFRPREVEEEEALPSEEEPLGVTPEGDRQRVASMALALAVALEEGERMAAPLAREQYRRGPGPWALYGRQAGMRRGELRGSKWYEASR